MVQKTTTSPKLDLIRSKLSLDPAAALSEASDFVRKVLGSSKANGIVVGLSGGVDSAVTAGICARAVGREKVAGLLLFESRTVGTQDHKHAQWVADFLGLETLEMRIDPVLTSFLESLPSEPEAQVVVGNLKARIRMMSLYYIANSRNLLVAGTGDRSEDLIGYFTKYGDGGVDFLPIAHMYKSQVRALGRYLGLAEEIVEKPSSPNLWEGHRAIDEIPLDYDMLDAALVCLFELKMTPRETATEIGVDASIVDDTVRRFNSSAHKRAYPPMVRSW